MPSTVQFSLRRLFMFCLLLAVAMPILRIWPGMGVALMIVSVQLAFTSFRRPLERGLMRSKLHHADQASVFLSVSITVVALLWFSLLFSMSTFYDLHTRWGIGSDSKGELDWALLQALPISLAITICGATWTTSFLGSWLRRRRARLDLSVHKPNYVESANR